MNGFTKLWSEILSSSIWNEDDKTRIVFITMLAAVGPDGIVRASVGGLAHQARVSKEDCEKAIEVLQNPDPDSRSTCFEGRRIEKIEGGFLLLNYSTYRDARNHDERKIYMAEYMRGYRKQSVNNRKQSVNTVNSVLAPLAKEEAEEKQIREEGSDSSSPYPSLEQMLEYFKEFPECDFTLEEIKVAVTALDVRKTPRGYWQWGKSVIAENNWHSAVTTKIQDRRDRSQSFQKPINRESEIKSITAFLRSGDPSLTETKDGAVVHSDKYRELKAKLDDLRGLK